MPALPKQKPRHESSGASQTSSKIETGLDGLELILLIQVRGHLKVRFG